MATLRDQLQAALGSAYRIDRELAGGGMSRVFVATDVALGRPVVVKVLHPELAAEVTADRFAREIQLAARLQQANIVPLLTAGHTGELPFYTMPFVEGLSVRQRLAESGQLSITETLGILRDVARALAYAHDAGVVHRDIKPENVLISGGSAVVTDFGIAKAISAARTQPSTPTITQAGASIGTPAYMAPEQAMGDPATDHRADIYAFGCLAFELLTGHPPFTAHAVHELITAHLTEPAAPVATLRPDVPVGLAALVAHCLEKQPERRPQSARELLDAIDAVATPTPRASVAARVEKRGILIGVTTAAVFFAIILYVVVLRPRGGSSGAVGPAEQPSLAVIPFVNVGGDSAQDYLADGVSDELATAIGKLPNVRLASRSAAYQYHARRDLDVRDVGKSLDVRFVVQGTVRRAGEQLRISAQLSDASSGVELWSQSFDRTTKDVFRTQDDIATAITGELSRRFAGDATGSAGPVPAAATARGTGTADVDAYDLYLRGEFALRARRVREAAEMFEQAIARDAKFARAWAGLSHASALGPYFTSVPIDSANRAVERAAGRALELDSTLAEAYMARGMAHMAAWKWEEARVAFAKAVTVDPNDVQSFFQQGRFFYYVGEDSSATAAWHRASDIDPFSALAVGWSAQLLSTQARAAEATAEIGRALLYDSTSFVMLQLAAHVYQRVGDNARAQAYARKLPRIAPWDGVGAYVLGITGDRAAAQATIRRIESTKPFPWFGNYALAMGYLGLGDTAQALTRLEQATGAREIWATYNRVQDPIFDPLRKSARWTALMRRVGLSSVPGALR